MREPSSMARTRIAWTLKRESGRDMAAGGYEGVQNVLCTVHCDISTRNVSVAGMQAVSSPMRAEQQPITEEAATKPSHPAPEVRRAMLRSDCDCDCD